MLDESALLGSIPDYLCISQCLKASAVEEGGERFIYMEASNEGVDQQNEVVLSKALAASADYYLQYGNIDIDHFTIIGAKSGVPNYLEYEVGRPIEVKIRDGKTFVKAQLYRGDSKMAEKANQVWESMTKVSPPWRWYPSVGGSVLEKSVEVDPKTLAKRAVIRKVRWNNVALSRTPVNQHIPSAMTMPVGAFAKCWGAGGLDMTKALEAGYGTDSASLTGGAAFRKQSLHGAPVSYWDVREKLAGAIRRRVAEAKPRGMAQWLTKEFSLSPDVAAEYVERFMRDLNQKMTTGAKT